MLKVDREGLYGYVIEYILQEDRPRITNNNGESYKKGDWFPYHIVLCPLNDYNTQEINNYWYNHLLNGEYIINKDDMRIRPVYCYFSSDTDFEYIGNNENEYLKG